MTARAILVLLLALAASTPACAVAEAYAQDWFVVRTKDGAYAYDRDDVQTVHGRSVKSVMLTVYGKSDKSVRLYVGDGRGNTTLAYLIDCATGRGAFAGSTSGTDVVIAEVGYNSAGDGWRWIPESGAMNVAADAACLHYVIGAAHSDNRDAALENLKTLSN